MLVKLTLQKIWTIFVQLLHFAVKNGQFVGCRTRSRHGQDAVQN